MDVQIYTDGGCRGNPGLGGYGVVLRSGSKEKEIAAVVENTTNNRMELTAAIVGLESLKKRCQVKLCTDSKYLCSGMTEWIKGWVRRGWRKADRSEVLNRDLWERLLELSKEHDIEWQWVRGHAGHEGNERCDQLANEAMDRHLAR